MRTQSPFPLLPAGICLAGLLFCLWVMDTGGSALCLTDGCALFQDLRLAGISLWQVGAVLFSLLLALALLRLRRAARLCAAAALAADTFLLGVMLFTAPCVNCLIVGTLIAAAYLAFRRTERPPLRPSPLAALWLAFLLFNAGGTLRDLSDPWSPLPHDEAQTSVHVYFSPSCRACQTLIASAASLRDAAWFPVAEDSRDILVIEAMAEKISAGLPLADAVEGAQKAVPPLPDFGEDGAYRLRLLRPDLLLLQFRLWKNRARVLSAGSDRLPFVQFMGLPSFLRETPPAGHGHAAPAPAGTWEMPAEIGGIGVAGFCSGASEAPCEDASRPSGGLGTSLQPEGPIDTSGLVP